MRKGIKKREQLETAHTDEMKKAIMFLYIYFSFYSTFLLLYSWTDYEIGLWAQTHPQPPSLITHLAAL